jgi:amino acid efflux transporter
VRGKLKLHQAIPLGIGSIMGSGILFLPSLTYFVSGNDVLISWIFIILLCIPGIFFFNHMIKLLQPENTTLNGMVELGLGKEVGSSVNLILLGTVVFGMPSAAIVAGSYFYEAFELPYSKNIISFLLISISILINFFGIKASAKFSFYISGVIVVLSIILIAVTVQPIDRYVSLKPDFDLNNIYAGAVLSFWAFSGFENLTFLYDKFENPRRDLIITIFVSIIVCGCLYLGLVANYSAIIPYFEIKRTTGLMQIAEYAGGKSLAYLIAFFALLAVGINLVSWTSGVVQLILQASKQKLLPASFINNDKRALIFLGCLFYASLFIGFISPKIFETVLTVVSTNFLLIYLLLIVSYFIIAKSLFSKIISAVIGLSLLVTLSTSSYLLMYPFLIFLFSFFRSRVHGKL